MAYFTSVIKEKNYLRFMDNNTLLYSFDINTCYFYSSKQKLLTRCPNNLKDSLRLYTNRENPYYNILVCMSRILCDSPVLALRCYSETFKTLDRLNSIGYEKNIFLNHDFFTAKNALRLVKEHFKDFCIFFKQNPDSSIYDFNEDSLKIAFYKKMKIADLEEDMQNIIWQSKDFFPVEKELELFIYYFTHGFYYFYELNVNKQTSSFTDPKFIAIKMQMINKVKSYFALCKSLNVEPKKDNNFFQNYINLQKSYSIQKMTIDNNTIKDFYEKAPYLFFENSDFVVVIPTTKEMIFEEGEKQKNCVYNHYLKQILAKKTYIVFIRKKTNINVPYITCEVNLKGRIVQYLSSCNKIPKGEKEENFKKEYQEHINSHFNN